ncbi:MAG: YdiU family protein [Rhizobiaceae bacterium]
MFQTTYAELPERFYAPTPPNPVSAPQLIKLNRPLAGKLGLDASFLASPEGVAMLAGNAFPDTAKPIAMAYAGHQFGNFVPQLGDGRALLVGEVVDDQGRRRDLQLKGSGPTRFSRGGDGRAAIGPVLREYIVSEAMAALGIPTTRTLAAVTTGERVFRNIAQPGAVLARVAASHIRIGTFQYFAARGDVDALRQLADYAIARHYPQLREREQPYVALLEAVIAAQAGLVARWMLVGFIHGVMNTDNMTISGETIDYGPCAFMDTYNPATVFSSIDQNGRYAYSNQPRIALWNLTRFAETLLPLIDSDEDRAIATAEATLKGFQAAYEQPFHAGLRAKLGLFTARDEDLPLLEKLFELMAANLVDFTLFFRALGHELDPDTAGSARGLFVDPTQFDGWAKRWHARLALEPQHDGERFVAMQATNPKYIPRNHRVEEAIAAATDNGDFGPFEQLLAVLERPYDEQPEKARYADAPRDEERVLQTFCGT